MCIVVLFASLCIFSYVRKESSKVTIPKIINCWLKFFKEPQWDNIRVIVNSEDFNSLEVVYDSLTKKLR